MDELFSSSLESRKCILHANNAHPLSNHQVDLLYDIFEDLKTNALSLCTPVSFELILREGQQLALVVVQSPLHIIYSLFRGEKKRLAESHIMM
jgi:hypothetical protein